MRHSNRPDILLWSGQYFNFLDPDPQTIDIASIAHALSNLCRFTGHTQSFYSVAQHSVLVSEQVPVEFKLQALLHDATEAFLGDVSRPLKKLLPDYQAIEQRVQKAVNIRFGLPDVMADCVKKADLTLLATEQRDLMPAHIDDWACLEHVQPLREVIRPLSPVWARLAFLNAFEQLTKAQT